VIRLDSAPKRGASLEIDKAALPEAGPDEYYVFQLVGLDVSRVGGVRLGRVTHVETGVANDILELDSGLLLPLVGACVREIDLNAGTIVVERGFDEAD
jgi:16S rRNA processing protein RimM